MKTAFSRAFFPAAIVLLAALLLVGFSQLRQAQQYNDAMAQKVERLRLQQVRCPFGRRRSLPPSRRQ